MNRAQFIVYTIFSLIFAPLSLLYATDKNNILFAVVGVGAVFLWLALFFSDRYANQRLKILSVAVGIPLGIAASIGIGVWLYTRDSGTSDIQFPFAGDGRREITGRAGLNGDIFSGKVYNGSDWKIGKMVFKVEAGKETRLLEGKFSLDPKETESFSINNGALDPDAKPYNWNIVEVYGRRIGTMPIELGKEERKVESDIKTLLPLSKPERQAYWERMSNPSVRGGSFFWIVTSSKDIQYDSDLWANLGHLYLDIYDYDAARSAFENATKHYPTDAPNGWPAYNSLSKTLRILGRYEDALAVAIEGIKHRPVSYEMEAHRAIALERLGKRLRASFAWRKAAEKYELKRKMNPREKLRAVDLFTHDDRDRLRIEKDELDSDFFETRSRSVRTKSLVKLALLVLVPIFGGVVLLWFKRR